MFTLFVNGTPVLKLSGISEIPARAGEEAWLVVDAKGKTIANYQPRGLGKHSPSERQDTASGPTLPA
jgi:hypothetical protein